MSNSLKSGMWKTLGLALLAVGVGQSCFASPVPEINPAMGGSAIALASGLLLVLRSRRK